MNMKDVNYTEEDDDTFADWIQDLRVSRDLSYEYQRDLCDGFSGAFEINGLGVNGDKSCLVRTKAIGTSNPSHGNVITSTEVWAFVVGNGYLVTNPIGFSV